MRSTLKAPFWGVEHIACNEKGGWQEYHQYVIRTRIISLSLCDRVRRLKSPMQFCPSRQHHTHAALAERRRGTGSRAKCALGADPRTHAALDPMGDSPTAEGAAAAMSFLASEDARHMRGPEPIVDGEMVNCDTYRPRGTGESGDACLAREIRTV